MIATPNTSSPAASRWATFLRLLEGVTRLGELMARPFAPAHYALGNPQNPFVHWLASAGIEPTDLNGCTSGSADDRNFCLATNPGAPDASTLRGLGQLLEHHNGVLFRAGQTVGAIQRQVNIFASMTGPVNVHTARTPIRCDQVAFRYRINSEANSHGTMQLSGVEFLRRFVQHVLPKGFTRIRSAVMIAKMLPALVVSPIADPITSFRASTIRV